MSDWEILSDPPLTRFLRPKRLACSMGYNRGTLPMRSHFLLGLLLTAFSSAQTAPPPKPQPASAPALPRFEDIGQQAGLTVSHVSSTDKRYIIESVSGGIGLIDCDN